VEASGLAASVIIVGVGDEEFELMEELDGDGKLLKDYNGKYAERDCVQFVRFMDCIRKGNLAEEVLAEVPEQFCFYMVHPKANKIFELRIRLYSRPTETNTALTGYTIF